MEDKKTKLTVWWDGDGYSPRETAPPEVEENLKKLEETINCPKNSTK